MCRIRLSVSLILVPELLMNVSRPAMISISTLIYLCQTFWALVALCYNLLGMAQSSRRTVAHARPKVGAHTPRETLTFGVALRFT